jgi:hypothetical protein
MPCMMTERLGRPLRPAVHVPQFCAQSQKASYCDVWRRSRRFGCHGCSLRRISGSHRIGMALLFQLPSSSLATILSVRRIDYVAFERAEMALATLPPHVQILCTVCFSRCNCLASISFETDSELTRIESDAFYSRCMLISIMIPRTAEILRSSCSSQCESLSLISFNTDSELTRVEGEAFSYSSLKSITIPRNV